MADIEFDVAVVGGGPAGTAASIGLAAHGRRTLLVHAGEGRALRVGETLGPGVAPWLRRLGAWDAFVGLGFPLYFGNRSAWGTAAAETNSFIANPNAQHGWHVDRDQFDRMLRQTARIAGAIVRENCRVREVTRLAERFRVELDDGRRPEARALIDASGRRASVSRQLGARRNTIDRLVAAASWLNGPRPVGGYALVEAVKQGWWFSAPLPGTRAVAAFLTDSDICRRETLAQPNEWKVLLERTVLTWPRLRDCVVEGRPEVFPAISHRLEGRALPPLCVAAGDSALAVDPLSGRGVERALRTGVWAAFAVDRALAGMMEERNRYEDALDSEFAAYREEREGFYGLEGRWREAPFWIRRRAA